MHRPEEAAALVLRSRQVLICGCYPSIAYSRAGVADALAAAATVEMSAGSDATPAAQPPSTVHVVTPQRNLKKVVLFRLPADDPGLEQSIWEAARRYGSVDEVFIQCK